MSLEDAPDEAAAENGPPARETSENDAAGAGTARARELTERVTARLEDLADRPVGTHAEVYASVHADLQQALAGLDD